MVYRGTGEVCENRERNARISVQKEKAVFQQQREIDEGEGVSEPYVKVRRKNYVRAITSLQVG